MLKAVKRFEENRVGRDLVVGDLHGMYSLLIEELDRIGFDAERDRLFCVGDLVDRGPEPMECLHLLDEPWFRSVMGNHDFAAMLEASPGDIVMTVRDYGTVSIRPEDWLRQESVMRGDWIAAQIRTMPFVIEIETADGKVGITHASTSIYNVDALCWSDFVNDLDYELSFNKLPAAFSVIWSRELTHPSLGDAGLDRDSTLPGVRHILHGHAITTFNQCFPYRVGNHFLIDGGAFLLSWQDFKDKERIKPKFNIVDVNDPGTRL